MKTRTKAAAGAGAGMLLLVVMMPVLLLAVFAGAGNTTPPPTGCPTTPVGNENLDAEQMQVAAAVIAAVRDFEPTSDLPHAGVIALATARQESGIRNLDYGDRDSLGVFQQRTSQGWGTRQEILDVHHATLSFLRRLVEVPNWATMAVTDAAAQVQRPAKQYRGLYEQWVPLATGVTEQLWGTALIPHGPETGADPVRITQANMWVGMSPTRFRAGLAAVIADQPDFVTLNETYHRSPKDLTPTGYASWRSQSPRDARETPVLWRTDTWAKVNQGTRLMHDRPHTKWGTRYVNWVTVTNGTDQVSVISGHASPPGPGRAGLLKQYIDSLNTLIGQLSASGPVLVGADLNTHYPSSGFLSSWLTASNTVSTFDALGEPSGGWTTGGGTGVIDYILASGVAAQAHQTAPIPGSDHQQISATFALAGTARPCGTGGGGAGVPANCTANGGLAELGLTPDALRVMRCALTVFGPHTVGGLGSRPNQSDHPFGRAVDIMINAWDTPAGNTEGWQIAEWAKANATELGVTYIIFDAKIWSPDRDAEGWRVYSHPTGSSNPTLDHLDHVHVSVAGSSGSDPGPTEDADRAVAPAAREIGVPVASTFGVGEVPVRP